MLSTPYITKPSAIEIDQALKEWNTMENYVFQESSLRKLFIATYPFNHDIDDVLIKVCALNDFYSTNIFAPYTVAKHIVNLGIDSLLKKEDPLLVNRIAQIEIGQGKTRNFYSFASKYCSHHKPEAYPIYDSFAEKMLSHLNKKYSFTQEKNWKDYPIYKNAVLGFKGRFQLESYSLKEIDKYLWITGKRHFSKDNK